MVNWKKQKKGRDGMQNHKKHVAIGFATGRTSFQDVLRAYIFHLKESHFLVENNILLSLFVAYDPSYRNTCREDYDNLTPEEKSIFYHCEFIGPEDIQKEIDRLVETGVLTAKEAPLCFGTGYAVQRNSILYWALRQKVDYLIFLDDDEYPLAVTRSQDVCLWSGQFVLEEHFKYLQFSDFTTGHHCGYLSPLPSLDYDHIMQEEDFYRFTQALSSDVLQWESVQAVIASGGVTYADKQILIDKKAKLVEPVHGAKYLSGCNLGINLTNPQRVLPFYNPPGARGEDSILSTCMLDYTVKSIPVYTFHDGFSFYGSLLKGVLPTSLRKISLYYESESVIRRFFSACRGWIRYKPLYTYLTQPEACKDILAQARENLQLSLDHICAYFNIRDFASLAEDLDRYETLLPQHLAQFRQGQEVWKKLIDCLDG